MLSLASRTASRAARSLLAASAASPAWSLPAVRGLSSSSSSSSSSSESHDDFKPKPRAPSGAGPAPAAPAELTARIERLVKSHEVVLFMKGTPAAPQCGFSNQVVRILNQHGADIHGVNILEDAALRQGMKDFSKWPTFPQVYIRGDFVGGCDILTQMHASGELAPMLAKKA